MLDIAVLVPCGSHQRMAAWFSMVRILHFRESSESKSNGSMRDLRQIRRCSWRSTGIWRPPDLTVLAIYSPIPTTILIPCRASTFASPSPDPSSKPSRSAVAAGCLQLPQRRRLLLRLLPTGPGDSRRCPTPTSFTAKPLLIRELTSSNIGRAARTILAPFRGVVG